MMRRKILIAFIISFITLAFTCKRDFKNFIEIDNKFNYDILCMPSVDFSDDSFFLNKRILEGNQVVYTVRANSISKVGDFPYCNTKAWDAFVKVDTLEIYVLHKENALKQNIFDYDSIVVKRIKITFNELVNTGCKLVVAPR